MAFRRKVKNFVKQYSDAVVKVREATSNDPWGPSGSLMMEIAEMTYHTESLSEIMQILWHRLNDSGKNWRHVYKALTLLDYLIKNGSKQVILYCHERAYNIQLLKEFKYIDKDGRDQGVHVRHKSRKIIELLVDEEKLKSERKIADSIKMQMLISASQSAYKLQPAVSNLGSCVEEQQVPQIEKPATDSSLQHIPVQTSSIQPVQDLLMIGEDKSRLLHTSSTDLHPTTVHFDLVKEMASIHPLNAGTESKLFIPNSKKSIREIEDQSKKYYTLKPPPKPLCGNIASLDDRKFRNSKEFTPDKSGQSKMVTWADEIRKLDHPFSSQSLLANFNIPKTETITFQTLENNSSANTPHIFESGTILPLKPSTVPAMDALYPWRNVPSNTRESQKSLSSQSAINSGFAFESSQLPAPQKFHRKHPTSVNPKPSKIISEESINRFIQSIQPPVLLSSVQYRPYNSTNPFLNPVMPTSSVVGRPFTADPAIASFQNHFCLPGPSCFGLFSYSSLYPPTITPTSTQVTNPVYSSLRRGVSSTVPQDLNFQTSGAPPLPYVPQRHPTNPFL